MPPATSGTGATATARPARPLVRRREARDARRPRAARRGPARDRRRVGAPNAGSGAPGARLLAPDGTRARAMPHGARFESCAWGAAAAAKPLARAEERARVNASNRVGSGAPRAVVRPEIDDGDARAQKRGNPDATSGAAGSNLRAGSRSNGASGVRSDTHLAERQRRMTRTRRLRRRCGYPPIPAHWAVLEIRTSVGRCESRAGEAPSQCAEAYIVSNDESSTFLHGRSGFGYGAVPHSRC